MTYIRYWLLTMIKNKPTCGALTCGVAVLPLVWGAQTCHVRLHAWFWERWP